jgi:hypothetical protein
MWMEQLLFVDDDEPIYAVDNEGSRPYNKIQRRVSHRRRQLTRDHLANAYRL